jgi:hypothetical protein
MSGLDEEPAASGAKLHTLVLVNPRNGSTSIAATIPTPNFTFLASFLRLRNKFELTVASTSA